MKKKLLPLLVWIITSISCLAQELPAIFKDTPRQILPAKTVASFPKKTFLENLFLLPDGSVLVNSHFEGIVYKISANGNKNVFARVNGKVTGIAAYGKDAFILTGNDENDKAAVYLLSSNGSISKLMNLPEGQFINGITHWKGDEFLIADSYRGCIWLLDVKSKKASEWIADDLLKRSGDQNPTPAANGIKIFNDIIYVSNTQKQLLLTIITENNKPLKPKIFLSNINLDDFIFDPNGNLYGATHVYNSVVRITPDKKVSVIAEQTQGASGSTACALKKNAKNYSLYVSTNGGMYLPPASGIEESKIIAIDIP